MNRPGTRDPERIQPILDKLKYYWERYPDWRLGQLIYNIVREAGYPDVFYIQDQTLFNAIDNFFERDKR